jgi:hypothetical protein
MEIAGTQLRVPLHDIQKAATLRTTTYLVAVKEAIQMSFGLFERSRTRRLLRGVMAYRLFIGELK